MVRIVKKHEDRKKEFLDTAQELFFSKGYEQTSVEAIIKKIGLSKGSFYYYFKSKEDLMDQLTIRMSESILREIKKVVQKEGLNATEKLNLAFQVSGNVKIENMALVKVLLHTLYDDKNIFFRQKIFKHNIKIIAPEFTKIIQQGIAEKRFSMPYPEKAAELIFEIGNKSIQNILALILACEQDEKNKEELEKQYRVYENAIERIVGAREGTVHIVSRETLDAFLDGFNRTNVAKSV